MDITQRIPGQRNMCVGTTTGAMVVVVVAVVVVVDDGGVDILSISCMILNRVATTIGKKVKAEKNVFSIPRALVPTVVGTTSALDCRSALDSGFSSESI